MKRLEIHISYICSNQCIFCSEAYRLKRFRDYKIPFNYLLKILKAKRKQGYNHVNFTGGEPTLFENFKKLLIETRKLGYKIYIGSNGISFADKYFCQVILPLIDEVSLSLHGSSTKIHNVHTNNKESYENIIKAFNNINDYITQNPQSIYFFCNSVITNYNINDLLEIIKLLTKFNNLRQLLISNISPEGTAYTNYQQLAVSYLLFKEKIQKAIDLANANNIIIRFFGLPLCVLGENIVYANDLNYENRVTLELGEDKGKIILKEKPTDIYRQRYKVDICNNCNMQELCGGNFSEYLKLYGDQEIKNLFQDKFV